MDWRTDPNTWNLGDQFMFGPAFLVSPVLKADAVKRSLYLPPAPLWYDFWSGRAESGGRQIDADAPLDRMPLFVRAGSIIPFGPEIEYAAQDPGGAIEVRVYRGADGKFDLYEDAGDSYDYEKGQHSVIPLRWDDRNRTLTIGAAGGFAFQTWSTHRPSFRIVLVDGEHGAGISSVKDGNADAGPYDEQRDSTQDTVAHALACGICLAGGQS